MHLQHITGFIFDLDGVIYKGKQPIDGAKEMLEMLSAKNKKHIFATNHTKFTIKEVQEKLEKFGIHTTKQQVMTASNATVTYLQQHALSNQVFIIGSGGIFEDLAEGGFEVTPENPEFVVVAWDPEVTYDKLFQAVQCVKAGAKLLVTGADRVIPSERGYELGFGALGAAISYATNTEPVYMGKPYPTMIDAAVRLLGTEKDETAIVGDTFETDLLAKQKAGLGASIAVLTGNLTREAIMKLPENEKPDIVIESVKDLLSYL